MSVFSVSGYASEREQSTSMPLDRLRRVLSSSLQVTVDSSPSVAAAVNRTARLQMAPKTAVPFAPLLGSQIRAVRPIDLLRKIGEITTPSSVNLARLSASWATRRYFWSIHDYGVVVQNADFRLSNDARRMERHQKTLLSDEFGVGFAALLMEQIFGASRTVDIQFALEDPAEYFNISPGTSRRTPDYLMWVPGGQPYVVECKGCQSGRSAAIKQLRRGMEQVRGVQIPGTVVPQLVIATHLDKSRTTVYVLDPPDGESSDFQPSKEVRKRGAKDYVVSDPAAFQNKLRHGINLQSLRWISQHATAAALESSVGYRRQGRPTELPDASLTLVETEFEVFTGVETPLAPELGFNGPTLFRGIERQYYNRLAAGDAEAQPGLQRVVPNNPLESVGSEGTCMLIRHLDVHNADA